MSLDLCNYMSELCWKYHVLCTTSTAASDSPRGVVINRLLFSYFLKALLAIASSSLTLVFAILQAISMVVNVGIHHVIIHTILSINLML